MSNHSSQTNTKQKLTVRSILHVYELVREFSAKINIVSIHYYVRQVFSQNEAGSAIAHQAGLQEATEEILLFSYFH